MQLPLHGVVPEGHMIPHIVPSQVALPPTGGAQGSQELPQVAGSLSLTQASLQRW